MDKKRKTIITFVALALVLLAVAGSYAFFTSNTNNDHKQEAKLATGTMALTFKDGNNGVNAQLMLGESVTKKFILKNTGSLEASLSLDWDQLINTYMDGSLTYRLVRTENDVEVEEIVPKTNMPVSKEKLTQTLASELSVPAEKEYYYDLIITFNSLEVDQEKDKTAVFNTHFNVGLPLQYRYYTLIVDPNGGTWKEFITSQSYLLKNNETLSNITNPTRVGYTFDGWELKGTSSTFDSGTFTMGISDASLTAKWATNKYAVTIDPDGGEYDGDKELNADYGSTITLSTPIKTGYTFSHWETTGGTITNKNTLTITEPSDVTVTAKWITNKYKYLVKHNKQNVDGNEYTTFEIETIENIDYGTDVTPEYKSYEGFTSPIEKKTITIKEDNTLNVVEYNYIRNKYTLTINPDGGEGGTQTQEVYYEGTVNLVAPTKPGYDLKNWTIESGTGTLLDNKFKMGVGDITIKANWKAQEYSLTFNPNGGSVTQGSKKITYATTYGELPIPTRDGYVFTGWYTTSENTGGEQITETTLVETTSEQTLYARWGTNTLLALPDYNYAEKIWEHKANITKVVFENTMNVPATYAYSYDISNNEDTSVMAYLVTDTEDSTKYVAYIQSNGTMYANEDSSYLFFNFTNLKNIEGLEFLNTSKVTNMYYMFCSCNNLTALNLNNFDTKNVTNMNRMFYCCYKLMELDLGNFNTSNVIDMDYMFCSCNNLTSLNVSSFNTSKVTNMDYMFCSCNNLTNLNVSSFDTSNVTTMKSMFSGCYVLTNLDVTRFDTRKVTNMYSLFGWCRDLTSLDVSKFNTSNVIDMGDMFTFCQNLTNLDVSSFNTSKVTSMYSMFRGCSKLTSLNLSNFNTSNVTNMSWMFESCSNLTTPYISNFNTGKVTTMWKMFSNCSSLTNLNINNFDTKNVVSMSDMFNGCSNLLTLDLKNFNTSKVTSMGDMFANCNSLNDLNLSSFNTNNVTRMVNMFLYCRSLTELDLSHFDTSKVEDITQVFWGCSGLKTLNLQNWDLSSATRKDNMFTSTSSSLKITVSNTTMRSLFIDISNNPKFTTSNFIVQA